jgi:8-oxo-dGTP pyrophosphatase MutT (NUDIX family)
MPDQDIEYVWHDAPVPAGLPVTQVYGWLLCPVTGRVLIQEQDDGTFTLPGGTPESYDADRDATLAREAFEETGITLDPETLRHVLSIHQRNPGTRHARIGFAFTPCRWDGEPVNTEPHQHSELVWADPGRLPPDTVGYAATVITAVERGLTFTLNGW